MGVLEEFIGKVFYYTIDAPVTLVRDFVESQQNKRPYYYYHRQYRRVTPIEDCDTNDSVCWYEAEMQYRRDRLVDQQIIIQLQEMVGKCTTKEGTNAKFACRPLLDEYDVAATNYDTKYGGLGAAGNAVRCMMKQKHRMLEDRKRAKEAGASTD